MIVQNSCKGIMTVMLSAKDTSTTSHHGCCIGNLRLHLQNGVGWRHHFWLLIENEDTFA